MTWTELLPPVIVGLAAVLIPGFLLGLALRMPLRYCLTLAPIFSVGAMTVAAVIAGKLGWSWGFAPYSVLSLVFIVLAAGMSFLLRKRRSPHLRVTSSWTVPGVGFVGAVLASTVIIAQLKKSILQPDAISQSFDNIFHLNAIRWIQQSGDGSSLALGAMTTADGSNAFYPAGWHDLVYLVFSVFPDSIPMAVNATTIVVGAFVWPISMLALALALKPGDRIFAAAAGGLSGAMVAFPGLLLKWGILYPNLLGYSVLPAFLALLLATVRMISRRDGKAWWPVVPSLLVGTAGIVLAHPNALTSAALLILPLVVAQLISTLSGRSATPRLLPSVLLALAALACVGIWWKVRPAPETATWAPKYSTIDAIGQFASNGFNLNVPEWALSALVLAGIFWALRTKTHRWIVISWLLLGWIWVIVASQPIGPFRLLMVGPWYADDIRLAALTGIPVIVLASFGVSYLVRIAVFSLRHLGVPQRGLIRSMTAAGLIVALAVAFFLGKAEPMAKAADSTAHEFKVSDGSILITSDEQKVLDRLDSYVPQDETIIVNPWEGSAVAYALEDRNVTSKHSLSAPPEQYDDILQHLNDAQSHPKACQEVRDHKALWYLKFDDTLHLGEGSKGVYKGLDGLESTGMVTPVYTSGDVGLYKVTGCS
ncbi:DUF6541 family protein [Kocuria massiliensis]|uniref:DUF6541 family protein n=1 Tax=Kocuria massiliensis TaxID=1926282 RepID=UPI00117AF164|nr:DUF6541 family protein [Kocuria massiliensis]